jgi:hypothetical protein
VGEDASDREVAEDASMVICPRLPYSPSKEEKRQHRITHWPYRSWCPECVMGKSRGTPHKFKSKSKKEPAIHPIICFDYMFLDGKSPTLVYRDKMSRTVFAHTVTQKGIGDGWILNKVVDDLDSLGYGRIIVKSDQPSRTFKQK